MVCGSETFSPPSPGKLTEADRVNDALGMTMVRSENLMTALGKLVEEDTVAFTPVL